MAQHIKAGENMAVRLISDSACDLPEKLAQKYHIEIIPTPVLIDDAEYLDGETIRPKEFYGTMRSGKKISTYHINSYMFMEHFKPYAQRGDTAIYICFSTGIAGTFNAANLAKTELLKEYPDFDLTIIDSKAASIGFGTVVLYAGMMLENGADKRTLIDAITYHCAHMRHVFTVDTLEYLLKGGRISRTSAMAGELLGIKPIITVDEAGALRAVEKVRGRRRSIQRLTEYVGEKGSHLNEQIVGIVHGDDAEMLYKVKNMLKDRYGIEHIVDNYVGCAIGAHTGPGIIGITFMDVPYVGERQHLHSYE